MFQQSILNTKSSTTKIWTKPCPEFKNMQTKVDFSRNAYKVSASEKSSVSQRFFLIKGHFLYYKKNSNSSKISGVFDLRWATVKILPIDSQISTQIEIGYTLLLVKNGRFTNIYLEGDDDVKAWREALSPVAIMTDLNSRFETHGKIGEGGFGEVKNSFFF